MWTWGDDSVHIRASGLEQPRQEVTFQKRAVHMGTPVGKSGFGNEYLTMKTSPGPALSVRCSIRAVAVPKIL